MSQSQPQSELQEAVQHTDPSKINEALNQSLDEKTEQPAKTDAPAFIDDALRTDK